MEEKSSLSLLRFLLYLTLTIPAKSAPISYREATYDNMYLNPLSQQYSTDNFQPVSDNIFYCGNVYNKDSEWNPFTQLGYKHDHMDLTYRIAKYSKKLEPSAVDREIFKAFVAWSEHTDLTFTQKQIGPVDIEIKFAEYDHGDEAFDGQYNILAHAQKNSVHFDDSEQWTIGSVYGVNLLTVATHEIGHSLGLDHSTDKSSLMFRSYSGVKQLRLDDIQGIQTLYGSKTVSPGYPSGDPGPSIGVPDCRSMPDCDDNIILNGDYNDDYNNDDNIYDNDHDHDDCNNDDNFYSNAHDNIPVVLYSGYNNDNIYANVPATNTYANGANVIVPVVVYGGYNADNIYDEDYNNNDNNHNYGGYNYHY